MIIAPKILVGVGIAVASVAVPTSIMLSGALSSAISWRPLSQDKEFKHTEDTDPYKDKWGVKYARYLVGVGTAKNDARISDNRVWWKKKYKQLKEDKVKEGKFSAIERGVSSKQEEDVTSLDKVCDSAYRTTTTDVEETATDTNKFNETQIWKYCSPMGKKPSTLKEYKSETYGETTIGHVEANKEKLVSTKDPSNEIFWKIRQEEFFETTGALSGSGATANQYFKKFYEAEINKTRPSDRVTIKEKCKEAYSMINTSGNQQNTNYVLTVDPAQVKKYCAFIPEPTVAAVPGAVSPAAA